MKIALPKNGEMVNQHFGKSEYFTILTIEDTKITESKDVSTQSLQHNHDGLAGLLKDEGVSVVILGGIGQGAYDSLQAKGFKIIRGASGKIEDVVKNYFEDKLEDKNVVCAHHGDEHHQHN